MPRTLLLAVLLAVSAAASAQLYRWVDKDGRVHYTATPPPAGATKSRTLETPATPPAPPAANGEGAAAANAAPKGPLTPAEQEAAFRKRQQEAQKAAEKAALERQQEETRVANCQRAREALATFESGQRISRTNPQGERYYLDDAARARETEAARKAVQDWCN
jgi:hypothetical protein